jgi:hypothetical protein
MARPSAVGVRLFALGVGLALAIPCRADRIELRGGGEVRGVVVPDSTRPKVVLVQTENGSKPLEFSKSQVLRVVRVPGPLDEYFARLKNVDETASAHYDFGLWCEQSKLTGLAQAQFQHAVALDKSHAGAHKKLGHVLHEKEWITYDELREAQGMVKHKGKWISKQQQDQLASNAALSAGQTSWGRRIRILYRNLVAGTNAERADAEARLAEIRDVAAIEPLVKILGNESEAMRARLAHILGAISGPEAQAALIDRILVEPDASVRQVVIDELAKRKESDTITRLARALRSNDPDVIGRAALGLAGLGATSAVPKLIPLLFQMERKTVMEPGAENPNAINASFGTQVGPVMGTTGGGSGMFATSHAVPILTGPVVGPGVVAFGATSIPFYSGASIGGGGAMVGGGGAAVDPRPIVRNITIAHPNHDVLAALETLTGRNFGFDVTAWRRWLATDFRAEDRPTKRAPQPGK